MTTSRPSVPFIQRFDSIVETHLERTALEVLENDGRSGLRLTYAELLSASLALVRTLEARGVGPGARVGLAAGRSAEHVVAMLAVWRLGAAFVPLDPELSAPRALEQLRRAGAQDTVLVAGSSPPEWHLGREHSVAVLLHADEPRSSESPLPRPGALAYVIFSSGSTGAPKGIAVEHAGLLPMLDAQITAFGVTSSDRCLWMLSPSFDASVSDIGVALLSGACLCIGAPGLGRDPRRLAHTLGHARITYIDLPPPLLGVLAPESFPALRAVVVGGEAPPPEGVRVWSERVRLFVVYGPTEATVCTSLTEVLPGARWDRPWLGTPLPHVRYRVVSPSGGDPDEGELWIGGPCLARGYLDEPALEASRFVQRDGARWHRTGDQVRRHLDGRIALVGRLDRQVKIDGKLVAPEEVEAELARERGVTRAFVVVLGSPPRLVAFVESGSSGGLAPGALRRALSRRLPEHLVPARVVVRERLPLTTTGKIDAAALVASLDEAPARSLPAGPEDLIDELLRGVAEHALGGPVALDEDLFERGLGSLGVVELLAAVSACGAAMGPEELARLRTLARVGRAARELERGSGGEGQSSRELGVAVGELGARVAVCRPRAAPPPSSPTYFVTGATGLLARSWIPVLLASEPAARVVALVRARDDADARARLVRVLGREELRARAVAGDVRLPRLGLAPDVYDELCRTTTQVLHAAAETSVVGSAADLWASNVEGTLHTLSLAGVAGASFDHVSTLSVFASTDRAEGVFFERDDASSPRALLGGYAQTKWLAEQLTRAAALRGVGPVRIHRLGLLTGETSSGVGARADWLARTLRGLAALGCAPRDVDPELAMDVTPVDHAARALVALGSVSHVRDASARTFHIAGAPVGLRALLDALREEGATIELVDPQQLHARAARLLRGAPGRDVAAAVLALGRALVPEGATSPRDLFQSTRARFDTTDADAVLAERGIVRPSIDGALLRRYARAALAEGDERG